MLSPLGLSSEKPLPLGMGYVTTTKRGFGLKGDAMDKKLLKAKAKRDKKRPVRTWWRKNGYKVWRVVLFPTWIYYAARDKRKEKTYKELQFSPELCRAYLDKVLPDMVARECEDVNCFLISDSENMGDIELSFLYDSRSIKEKYRRFFSRFRTQVKDYVLNEYTIDGYDKTTITNWVEWERVTKKYEWRNPYDSDYSKGVVFVSKT